MLKTTDIYVVHEKLSLLYVAVWVWVGWGGVVPMLVNQDRRRHFKPPRPSCLSDPK